ncbi:contact-dependent growth inhibition system immunity protein [Pasteurella multocida]|uniref:contact-dependent growth inhibition system immunity protein n=1 Tax=Pasteurella multocida TaxID=747 RepID=UPI001E591E19|nr:contact-dependent growth inhibition system immunity protein [Pasteurella multocida]
MIVEKTSKYISIQSYLIGRVSMTNINKSPVFLDTTTSLKKLGEAIYLELENSREISGKEFEYYWNNDDLFSSFQENLNKDVMRIYGYKNYRQICKDTLFLSVSINNNILYITPSHQDGLGTFGTARDRYGKAIEFTYPIDLSDEELGKAVMDAFEYSTSIYKKK